MKSSFFAILLACTLLFTGLPVSAAESAPAALRFEYCDTSLAWVNGAYPVMSIADDAQRYTEAPSSLRVSVNLAKGSNMVLYHYATKEFDVSPYTHLEFDLYVTQSDLSVFKAGQGQLELTSSGKCDVAELTFGPNIIWNQITQDGWNHISIPLSSGSKNSTDATQVFDPTRVNYFRFYLVKLPQKETTITYQIDNMYFSTPNSPPPEILPSSNYQSTLAPCQNNGYAFGDLNEDAAVNSVDALLTLQYAVDKVMLTNQQLAMGDVTDDGRIDATDALDILQLAVNKLDSFAVQNLETLPQTVEVGINKPHLVHTHYPTDSRVIAETDVIYWGAQGDGVTDDTVAFQKALAYAGAHEGGTVFVPAGNYVIRGNLLIPNGVTLQGDSPKADANAPVEGTVLMAYAGRGEANGTPFIRMDSSSHIANLSIWYPQQTMEEITPYPFTIRQAGHYGIAVSNVRLVNSYQGIGMFYTNSLQNIRGVVGTALKTGLILDGNVDICRVENVTFTPDCWINSGLSDTAHAHNMKDYLFNNATAFKFEHVDWTYVCDIAAKGYHVALGNSMPTTRDVQNSPNGHVFNVNFEDCYIGYDAQYINPIGMMITQGTIEADIPIKVSEKFDTSFSLNHLNLISTGEIGMLMDGSGIATLEDCTIQAKSNGIIVKNGTLSLTRVTFQDCDTHIQTIDRAKRVIATNCMTAQTLTNRDTCSVIEATWNDALVSADYSAVAENDYNQQTVARPIGDAFVNVAEQPYGVVDSSFAQIAQAADSAPAIQQAINDVKLQGGGTVYVPSGRYRLDSALVIPTGVELRGSCTFPQHSHAYSTTFYTTYGENGDAATPALITLEPKAGIDGFKVYYDQQPGGQYDCKPYAFTLRGTGINNYVKNVNFINSFYQTDLATYPCDGHYVNGATGYPLEQGIVVGGGSQNGIVRDCQFNVHYFGDNPYSTMAVDGDSFRKYATDHSEAFVVKDTTHQIMYHNFVLGVHSGIAIDQGADVFVLAHGTDGGDRSMTVRGTPSGKITFVNSQLVVIGPGTDMTYIYIEDSFTGTVNMIQTNMWGQPTHLSVLVGGGRLNLSQGTNIRSGSIGVQLFEGSQLFMDTINHVRHDLSCDLMLQGGTATTFGNIYASGGLLTDFYGGYQGYDLPITD